MLMQKMVGRVSGIDPFYVIRFIELPNENTTEYVIVPESWIRLFCFGPTSSVKEVLVAYPPLESSESTLNRVIAKESPENEWSADTGIIEFKADSYTDALAWSIIKNLNLTLMDLDDDDIGAIESSGSSRKSLASSNASQLQTQIPAGEINPSIADEGFPKIQPIKATAAEYFDDALSSMADNYKPIKIETVQNIADDLSSSEDELIINEDDQNSQTANSDDIYGPATVQEIPNMSNVSCKSFEPSGKKPLSSVNLGDQGRMSKSMITRMAGPPRGHLHPSKSSSAVDQNHLAQEQDITEYKPAVENDFDMLFSSAYKKATPSVPLFGRSDSTGTNGKGTPSTAKNPSNFSNQFCSAQLPSLELTTATKQKHDSLGTQQQMIDRHDIPNKENMKTNNQNSDIKNKKPSRLPDTNPADHYYVVQFKNVAILQTKYTCVRSCWITAITEFEVEIACPADPIETQPNMFLQPIKLRKEWRSYSAVVKYVTVSFNDAKSWIYRETKKFYIRVKNDTADTAGLPHKRAATSTADEVPLKKRLMTVNAVESAQHPDISALSIIANTWCGENHHHTVKHSQAFVQPEPVPQSYPIPAPQFPPQMQSGYSVVPRYPTQNKHPGLEHQYPPVCGKPNIQRIQAHQSSSFHDIQTYKRSNPVNNTVDPYHQRNHQNTMCPQSYNLCTQCLSGHQYLPNQQRFSHDHNGQILTNTNRNYPISHRNLMGPCPYNGNYSAVAASHGSRRGGTAGLPAASRDPRLQPRVNGNSVQQNCNNSTVCLHALEDLARPIAADNQPRLGCAATRNMPFQEFKIQCLKAFYKTANEDTIEYIRAMLRATTNLCSQRCVPWNVTFDEFQQRVEAFRKEAHEYNKHYMVAMNNTTTGLCNNINGYFIH